jgi:hypothetical protein
VRPWWNLPSVFISFLLRRVLLQNLNPCIRVCSMRFPCNLLFVQVQVYYTR